MCVTPERCDKVIVFRIMAKRTQSRGTLASLAAELGVSRTTVSNAYNRPEQLSAALRERILATAERLGYPGPDPTARSLRTRRTVPDRCWSPQHWHLVDPLVPPPE